MEKIIIAQLSIKKESIKQFLNLTDDIVIKSNNEKGCLTYRLLNEINKPNEFIIYEKYIDDNAVSIHNSSKHFKEFINNVPKFLTKEPIIDIY